MKDCNASDEDGTWRDECGRAGAASFFSATRTGRIVQGTLCGATRELGSHGVIATCWTRVDSAASPFASEYSCQLCEAVIDTATYLRSYAQGTSR
jgi:hypothetical protein